MYMFIRDDGKRKRKFCVYSFFSITRVCLCVGVCVRAWEWVCRTRHLQRRRLRELNTVKRTCHAAHFIGLRCPRQAQIYLWKPHSLNWNTAYLWLNCSLSLLTLAHTLSIWLRCWTELKTRTTICRIRFYNGFDLLQKFTIRGGTHTHSHVYTDTHAGTHVHNMHAFSAYMNLNRHTHASKWMFNSPRASHTSHRRFVLT